MQVAAVVQLGVQRVQDLHPVAKKVIIQSDNASCFASQEIIPFVLNMNTRLHAEKTVVFSICIFNEAHIGKTLLDTHYSFINNKFQAYVEYKNDILIKDDIVMAVRFNGGIYGTTAIRVDSASIFGNRAFKTIKFKIKTGTREIHEVCWLEDYVHIKKS